MAVSPPRPLDIPLSQLRAFEAAARLGGFAAAGAEIGVSAGAITAHIKALEARLGAPLFSRSAKGVVLTALGRRALPEITQAFDALSQAARKLREEAAPQTVHIATLPSIAQLWLSPRLPALRALAPEIAVSITAMEHPPDLKRMPYDLCLFYDATQGWVLDGDVIFPVCAPALCAHLTSPADLARVACLSDATWSDDWDAWLSRFGQGVVPRGPVFSLYALAVEEAVNGAGVLIGHRSLIARHLADGRLTRPFAGEVALPKALRLWSDRPLKAGSAAHRVAEWLRADPA